MTHEMVTTPQQGLLRWVWLFSFTVSCEMKSHWSKNTHEPSQKETPFGWKYIISLHCKGKYNNQEDVSTANYDSKVCVSKAELFCHGRGSVCVCRMDKHVGERCYRFKIHRNNPTVLLFAYLMHMTNLHFLIQSSISVVSTWGVST